MVVQQPFAAGQARHAGAHDVQAVKVVPCTLLQDAAASQGALHLAPVHAVPAARQAQPDRWLLVLQACSAHLWAATILLEGNAGQGALHVGPMHTAWDLRLAWPEWLPGVPAGMCTELSGSRVLTEQDSLGCGLNPGQPLLGGGPA